MDFSNSLRLTFSNNHKGGTMTPYLARLAQTYWRPAIGLLILMSFANDPALGQWIQTNGPYYGGGIGCLAVNGPYIFAGTDSGGVFRSTDNGTNWTAINNGLTSRYVNALLVTGNNLFAGTNSGVFLSTDNGSNWVSRGMTSEIFSSFATSPNGAGGANLFAATRTQEFLLFTSGGGVHRSTNNGMSWTDISTSRRMDVNALTFAQNGDFFAGATPFIEWIYFLPFLGPGGVFRYNNDNTSWTPVNAGLTNTSVYSLAVNGANLFAGTGGGVFLSANNGASWTRINNGLPGNTAVSAFVVVSDGTGGGNIFAGTDRGVFLSTNNGTSWSSMGLTSLDVRALAVNGSNLFAGTRTAGVWRRPLSELITSVEEISGSELPRSFALGQNYPNPFNPSTKIQFSIPQAGFVTLKVYDLLGREVATLVEERLNSGKYETNFNAGTLASGVYIYRLQVGSDVLTKKLLLLK
jgi:photosystem II stability/assembly factor-like uncharacterized protein